MKTSTKDAEMDATTVVRFSFAIGKKTVIQELELDMEDFLKNPSEMGDTLRSFWFAARDDAAAKHREFGNVPPPQQNMNSAASRLHN